VARIETEKRLEADNWTPFELFFNLVPGRNYDSTKQYMFTIVFSSSLEGDRFNGAPGSELWIDEVQLIKQ